MVENVGVNLKGAFEDLVEFGAILQGRKKQDETNWQKRLVWTWKADWDPWTSLANSVTTL